MHFVMHVVFVPWHFYKKTLLNKWFNGNFSGLSAFAILKGDKSFIQEI